MGLRPATGSVHLDGADLSHASTRARLRAGIGYVPEDRSEDGLVGDFSVADNLILDVYNQPPYASGIALNLAAIRDSAVKRVEEYDVRTTSVGTAAILRFARPIAYQNFPQTALPEELQDDNPRGIWRLVDGETRRGEL